MSEHKPTFEVTINGGTLTVTGEYTPEQQKTYYLPYFPSTFDVETCHTASGSDVLFLVENNKEYLKQIEKQVLKQIGA